MDSLNNGEPTPQPPQHRVVEPPECYGTGRRKAGDRRWPCFHVYKVSPQECFHCPLERRCLAQQRRGRQR
jgi:hypothetical protein